MAKARGLRAEYFDKEEGAMPADKQIQAYFAFCADFLLGNLYRVYAHTSPVGEFSEEYGSTGGHAWGIKGGQWRFNTGRNQWPYKSLWVRCGDDGMMTVTARIRARNGSDHGDFKRDDIRYDDCAQLESAVRAAVTFTSRDDDI
jgi:hypothetical protein